MEGARDQRRGQGVTGIPGRLLNRMIDLAHAVIALIIIAVLGAVFVLWLLGPLPPNDPPGGVA